MNDDRFIADPHLSHKGVALKRGFSTVEEHDAYLISQWNSVVKKGDNVYILGDITMEKKEPYHLLDKLNGNKFIVGGNHERKQHTHELLKHVNSISGMISYKNMVLTHCPIHPDSLNKRYKRNIHGHIHEKTVKKHFKIFGVKLFSWEDKRYVCVSCEHVDFKPKTLKELGIPSYKK